MTCVQKTLGRWRPLLRSSQCNQNVVAIRHLTEGLFSGFLTNQWNRVDAKRLKEVGPDRLCAEWLLRCGGSCKVVNRDAWHVDYNALVNFSLRTRIEAIDGSNSCVNSGGFRHVHGLTALKAVKLDYCLHFCDSGLDHLKEVRETLTRLRLSNCPQLTDAGLTEKLPALSNLAVLHLTSLPAVKDLDAVAQKLKRDLPGCDIVVDATAVADKEADFFAL